MALDPHRHRRPPWWQQEGAVEAFAAYCAPTALSYLAGVSPERMAEFLIQYHVRRRPGHRAPLLSSRPGYVWTAALASLIYRAWDAQPERIAGSRPTVAGFLREYPGLYTGPLTVTRHIITVWNGEVRADTRPTNSRRARVWTLYPMRPEVPEPPVPFTNAFREECQLLGVPLPLPERAPPSKELAWRRAYLAHQRRRSPDGR